MDGISRLVSDSEVLRNAWETEPFVSRALGTFDDIFSVEKAQELISTCLPVGSTRLYHEGAPISANILERTGDLRGRSKTRVVDGSAVTRKILDGATLVIDQVQLYSPEVASFATSIASETGYDTDCTAFLTPANAGGVRPHRDPVSVFLRQVHGTKRWLVWSPAEKQDAVDTTEPLLDVVLREGDCLYIPRGARHAGETFDDSSVHLSISVSRLTWGAVLSQVVAAIGKEDDVLSESLPPQFAMDNASELLPARLALLVERLTAMPPEEIDLGPSPQVRSVPRFDLLAALGRVDTIGVKDRSRLRTMP